MQDEIKSILEDMLSVYYSPPGAQGPHYVRGIPAASRVIAELVERELLYQKRLGLINRPKGFYTFQGRPATIGGAKMYQATVTTSAPGFYAASWEEIERAASSDGVIENAVLVSGAWLGCE